MIFMIHIKVGEKALIDREKQSVLNLIAIATDTPAGGKERRKNEVSVNRTIFLKQLFM